ncbi:MAG: dephospho-CoA kinase [Acidimicrobiia bacterium]|nr:dephospho-CoA kinase [Acidimicrobiia bacterium]
MSPDGNDAPPLRVIVSGGIGSGKTTVVRKLGRLGAVVIDADRIGHQVLEPGGGAYAAVADRWPAVMVDGRVDRSRLAAIVFTDPVELAALEAISHPLIAAEIQRRVAGAEGRDVVLELPLNSDLAGPGWIRIVVDAPEGMRLDRAVARGMDRNDVASRMAAQPDRATWVGAADVVIENHGTIAELETEVARIWAALQATD